MARHIDAAKPVDTITVTDETWIIFNRVTNQIYGYSNTKFGVKMAQGIHPDAIRMTKANWVKFIMPTVEVVL